MSDKMEELGTLPNGTHLFRKRNSAGGWTYYSDECGCMSAIWDTCIANESTLLAAILCEQHRSNIKFMYNQGWRPTRDMQGEQMVATGGSFLDPIENGSIDDPLVSGSGVMNITDSTQSPSGDAWWLNKGGFSDGGESDV